VIQPHAHALSEARSDTTCCPVTVDGGWQHNMSVPSTLTMTISYGYTQDTQKYDLYATYNSTMKTASSSFKVLGFGASKSLSGFKADFVVDQAYIHTTVGFNMTWVGTWDIRDGRYLYQWVWTTKFKNQSTACSQPNAYIRTLKFVQADLPPKCLPGTNIDPVYQDCEADGYLPR